MAKNEVDMDKWGEITEHAEELKQSYSTRNENNLAYEDMYLMDWEEPTMGAGNIVKTISPDARNAIHGAVRLMVATDPLFNVPRDRNKREKTTEKIEKAASYLWGQASRAHGSPVHYDAILSSLLYGEMHLAITSTMELVEYAKQIKQSKAYQARAEVINSRTPYLLDVWNPKDGYPEFDSFGMVSYLRETKVKAGQIRLRFGQAGYDYLQGKASNEDVELRMWYDLEYYAVSLDDNPVICKPHELVAIPVVCTLTDGSMLFDKAEHQRQPFLYTLYKSGMWKRQNLSLTALYTLIEGIILMPQIIHETPRSDPDKAISIDYGRTASVIDIDKTDGEDVRVFDKSRMIDPNIQLALTLAEDKVDQSTIQKTALGQPLGSSVAYSTYALLSQTARVPLIAVQKRAGWGIAETVEVMLKLYKDAGKAHPAMELKPSEVFDSLQLTAVLDIALPQDKLQLANIANILTNGDNPLTDREWARENILNIAQSREMDENIWAERASDVEYQTYLQGIIAQAQMKIQQQQMELQAQAQGMQGGGQPGGGMMNGGSPPNVGPDGMPLQGMPPSQMQGMGAGAMMPQGQSQMVQGGLPPQMAGMVPGQGEGVMPDELAGMLGGQG